MAFFSALVLSNFMTRSVIFYEERLAKEVNTFFSVSLPAGPSVLLLHTGVYSHLKNSVCCPLILPLSLDLLFMHSDYLGNKAFFVWVRFFRHDQKKCTSL